MAEDTSKSELLDRLLEQLTSGDAAQQLAVIETLPGLGYSSAAILRRLETLALDDTAPEVQQAANTVLGTENYRRIQSHLSRLSSGQRSQIIAEINTWVQHGLLDSRRAEVIARRYNFDMRSQPAPQPATAQATPRPDSPPQTPQPAGATAPRPSLLQTLTSEASIKVWLYLGAFFVIASALILAALVELLRTPILVSVTALFGAGALILKKRLPQPSFTLWAVAASLALITARVVGDNLALRDPWDAAYWLMVLLLFTGVWYFSTRLYESRFFSLALGATGLAAAWQAARIFSADESGYLFATMAAIPVLILVGRHFIHWRDRRFAGPMLAMLGLTALLGLAIFGAQTALAFVEPYGTGNWMAKTLTGIILFASFAAINRLVPMTVPLWTLSSALALLPVGWLFTQQISMALTGTFADSWAAALGVCAWGALLALSGEKISTTENTSIRQYATPLVLAALPNLLIGALMDAENAWLLLGLSAGSATLLTLMFVRNPRWWVWSAGIFSWVIAYIALWQVPALNALNINSLYLATGLYALLGLADWARPGDLRSLPAWRWPLRAFFAFGVSFTAVAALALGFEETLPSSLTYALLALIFLAYAVRFDRPYLGIGFTFFAWAAINTNIIPIPYALAVISLAALYYFVGSYLPRPENRFGWPRLLRWSGLAVSLIAGLSVFMDTPTPYDGGFVLVAAGLFLIESCRRTHWMELPAYPLLATAAILLATRNSLNWEYALLGVTILPLWLDFGYTRLTAHARPWRRPVLSVVSIFIAISAIALFWAPPLTAVIIGIGIALTLLALAVLYRNAQIGYAYFAFLALVVIHALRLASVEHWSLALIALSALIYALGWLDKPTGWGVVRRHSGLALATLTALSVPLENSGLAGSLPVALAAALWTVEAFRRRNVWLGFPANALYLMAYYIILIELDVRQPQFFSVGAAALGMLMHYLLLRAGSNTGAFITGMTSQLVLLSVTYIQMVAANSLGYFAALFFQSLVVLIYGLVIRSRSLVFTPIAFVVLGVITVVFSVLKGIATVILIGCTGILFILLGIGAVLMRERISDLRGRLSDWRA